MKTAVIYARYSSDRQTEQSIEGQLTVCYKYAEQNDIAIVDTYIDRAMTGTNDNRDAFQQMLRDSNKRAWDIVLVYKLDRFSRNKYEMAMHKKTLRDNGIKLVSAMENIPDTPEGIILESLLEGMAEYYSAELSQKVRRGMNESRKKGNFTGGFVPFGFRVEGTKTEGRKVVVCEEEAQVVRKIFDDFIGGRQINDMFAELLEKNILCRGKPFTRNTVYRMVANEKYAGIYHYKDEEFENIYPPIVSKDIFQMAKMKLDNNKYGKHPNDVVYSLKNKCVCGVCGNVINSYGGRSHTGKFVRYYNCVGRKNKECDFVPIRKELLEELVLETIMTALAPTGMVERATQMILEANKQRLEDTSILTLLNNQMADLQKSIDNMLNAIEQGIVTESTRERLDSLEERKRSLELKIAEEKCRSKKMIQEKDVLRYLKAVIKKEPTPLIQLLVKKVVVTNDTIKVYFNYTDDKRPDDGHQAFLFYSFEKQLSEDLFKYSCNPSALKYLLEAYF